MALSFEGWLLFISILIILIIGCGFGLRLIFESKKRNAKLLFFAGLSLIFMSLIFLGQFIDFIVIFVTGRNFNNKVALATMSAIWMGPIVMCLSYLGAELILPQYKKYILTYFLMLICLVMLIFFLDPLGSYEVTSPPTQGEISHYVFSASGSLFFIVFCIIALSGIIFLDSGFIYKIIQSEGVIRKKFLFLIIAITMYAISIILYALVQPGVFYTIFTIIISVSFYLFYLGLREEPEKKEKLKPKKEVKVEGDLFRISQYKKEDITEEEVSISKEKKICLVCKGKVLGNTYICTECEAFYCMKCSQAIINLENACWACDAPIDKSKPVKPFKKVEEEIDVEISEKPQKKPKAKK